MFTELVALGIIFLAFLGGFLVGKTHNGVSITINHEQKRPEFPDKPEYNPSTEDALPDEIRQYFEQNQGMLR